MSTDANQYVHAGIRAIKQGDKEKGRQLLEHAISLEEEHELAWLWLTAVVTKRDEKRLCLENVLTINPNNKSAQNGLVKLGFPIPEPLPTPDEPVGEALPYWMQPDPTDVQAEAILTPAFDDAWDSDEPLCAYCATPVTQQERHCPKCGRKMNGYEPYSSSYSRSLKIWLTLRTLGHVINGIYLVRIGIALLATVDFSNLSNNWAQLFTITTTTITYPISVGLTIALFLRQRWAYWIAVTGTVLSFLGLIVFLFLGSLVEPPQNPAGFFESFFIICITAPFLLIFLGMVYLVITSSGDFVKVKQWRIVRVNAKINDAVVLDKLAQSYARRQMWGTAVAYWQRASGRAPGHTPYLIRLAKGYARLGFIQRAIDTLHTAQEKAKNPRLQKEISRELALLTK